MKGADQINPLRCVDHVDVLYRNVGSLIDSQQNWSGKAAILRTESHEIRTIIVFPDFKTAACTYKASYQAWP